MADEAIGNSSLQLFMSPGCNDWRVIDDLLENGHKTQPCDGLVVPLEGYDMITAWSGATPAEDAVRTAREEDLVAQMEDLFQRARSARYVILNAHARPKSVQKLIKKLQPMLYVFSGGMGMGGLGGVSHIGRTVGLNPGVAASDDGNGSLRGALVELEHGQVKDYHHVSG
jgi:Icc-related predicted phosphoesterase